MCIDICIYRVPKLDAQYFDIQMQRLMIKAYAFRGCQFRLCISKPLLLNTRDALRWCMTGLSLHVAPQYACCINLLANIKFCSFSCFSQNLAGIDAEH
jgi:hypothetical protein